MMSNYWMYGIILCQVFSILIITERVYELFFKRKITQKELAGTILKHTTLHDSLECAEKISKKEPIGKIAVAGIRAALNLKSKEEIQMEMDKLLLEENSLLEKRIGLLALTANVATLIGLLGTVIGLIKSFSIADALSGAEKTVAISEGIFLAMNATAYGLMVAVPSLIMYAVLQNRASRLTDDLNKGSLNIFIRAGFNATLEFPPPVPDAKILKFERKNFRR